MAARQTADKVEWVVIAKMDDEVVGREETRRDAVDLAHHYDQQVCQGHAVERREIQ